MEFLFTFVSVYAIAVVYLLPVIGFLLLVLSFLAGRVRRAEGWSWTDALYYTAITATTVGYGDLHPISARGRFAAVWIALTGILLTGILVSVGVQAIVMAAEGSGSFSGIR